jgi:hypothetical protein
MHRFTRSVLVGLSVVGCLWPAAVGAQAQDSAVFSVDQVRNAFSTAGYQVEPAYQWDWTQPPVTSFQVRDPANDRVLMVLVYPSAAAAEAARLQAGRNDPRADAPHLVAGYGASAWEGNVALAESSQSQLQALYQMQADRDNGVYTADTAQAQDPSVPGIAVDLDFLQALNNGVTNL